MPLQRTQVFRFESAYARLTHARGSIYALSNLWSHRRGRGEARKLMEIICSHADENGLTLILIAQEYGRFDRSLTNEQLVEFYKKFGFDIDTDSGIKLPPSMTRYPKREEK